jgi:hypothetical protein
MDKWLEDALEGILLFSVTVVFGAIIVLLCVVFALIFPAAIYVVWNGLIADAFDIRHITIVQCLGMWLCLLLIRWFFSKR